MFAAAPGRLELVEVLLAAGAAAASGGTPWQVGNRRRDQTRDAGGQGEAVRG